MCPKYLSKCNGSAVKIPFANAEDTRDGGSIPESGGSPGEGNGNSLQYSCLENPMERELSHLWFTGSERVEHD